MLYGEKHTHIDHCQQEPSSPYRCLVREVAKYALIRANDSKDDCDG
jgi:hypothetical protein